MGALSYSVDRDGVWRIPTLRPYETKAVREIQAALPEHGHVVAVGPTGCGKTVIAAALLAKLSGMRILWLAHRIELVAQAVRHLLAAGVPVEALGVATGPLKKNEGARVLVGSVDTIRNMGPGERHLVVVDEAHRTMAKSYRKIVEATAGAWVLGLTATPWRLDGQPLGSVFRSLVLIGESAELAADGFLAAPTVYGIQRERAREMVSGLRRSNGDYSGKSAERVAMRMLLGDVVSECARLAPDERTLVFATTRAHGRELHKAFLEGGRRFGYLDGTTPAGARERMIEELDSSEIEGIVNVDVLSEGFDCPPVKCIALARPTRSLTRFMQQCGRASRPHEGRRPIILDHAGNCWRFGLPTVPRKWSLSARGEGKRTGAAPIRVCPACNAVLRASAQECSECGMPLPRAARDELSQVEAELEKITMIESEKKSLLERLRTVASARGVGDEWCQRVLREAFGGT
jgi:DNA repair protein RadD